MRTKIELISIVILVALVILLLTSFGAQPDSGLSYNLKRLQEKVFLNFKFSPEAKINYYNLLLDERLQELKYLVGANKTNLLWSASLRYSTTAGELTDILIGNNLQNQAPYFINKFTKHREELQSLLAGYPRDFSNEDWKFLEDGINYLNLYLDKLSKL